jgi:transposase
MTRARRVFTKEYKAEVVKLVIEGNKSPGQVAKDLDLTPSAVAGWVQQAKTDAGEGLAGALTTAEKQELSALRRETKQLRMERDFLKKAAAFFARENT